MNYATGPGFLGPGGVLILATFLISGDISEIGEFLTEGTNSWYLQLIKDERIEKSHQSQLYGFLFFPYRILIVKILVCC